PQRVDMAHRLWGVPRPSDHFLKLDGCSPLPRAVGNVNSFVVPLAALPQCPEDLHPAVRQRSVSTGCGVYLAQLLLKVGFGPAGMPQALSCKIIGSASKGMRTVMAELHRFALPAAPGNGHCAGHRLQR